MRARSPSSGGSPKFRHRPSRSIRGAEFYLQRFHDLGLHDAALDSEGNVVALRKGSGKGLMLVISAHLDTVFPETPT